MADKPLYYGSSKGGPMYYGGGKTPMYYGGGKTPMYYGGSRQYGQYGSYGSYGSYGAYGQEAQGGEDGSIVGTITLGRMLRVVSQRWLSVFVFLIIGLLVAFAVYRISPTIYEAKSEFTMDMRRATRGSGTSAIESAIVDYGNNYAEIFNTRLSDWRSSKILKSVLNEFRSNNTSTVTDDEVIAALVDSKLELQRNSRIITIAIRSKSAKLAAALANAYAKAIESYTDEENALRCDKAVSQIHANVEKKRREVDKIASQLLEFRTTHKVDNLRSTRDTIQQSLSKTTADILTLEAEEGQLVEWEKALVAVQKDPESFGSLPTGAQRAQEIATEYRAFLDASTEYSKLQFTYTENHPEVVAKLKELDLKIDRIAGIVLGSVPLAAALSLETGIPYVMVRKEKKDHGTGKLIEGVLNKGDKVLVVEDVITSAGSSVKGIGTLREEGAAVEDVFSVIDREAGGSEALREIGVRLSPLVKASDLLRGQ